MVRAIAAVLVMTGCATVEEPRQRREVAPEQSDVTERQPFPCDPDQGGTAPQGGFQTRQVSQGVYFLSVRGFGTENVDRIKSCALTQGHDLCAAEGYRAFMLTKHRVATIDDQYFVLKANVICLTPEELREKQDKLRTKLLDTAEGTVYPTEQDAIDPADIRNASGGRHPKATGGEAP